MPGPMAPPRWYLIPARVVLVTFLVTLLSFAVSLLFGILGLAVRGQLQRVHPDMAIAYRHIALPVAAVIGVVAAVGATVTEIRNYRQSKALAGIARSSR